jgi:hypothetical protein
MRNVLPMLGMLAIFVMAQNAVARSNLPVSPLCELQVKVAQGEHRTVRVRGVYLAGLEGQYLVDAGCSGRSTDIEFALKSHRLWKRLVQISNESNDRRHASGDSDPVLVVFEGEFYGPPVPDPKLPEAIRKNYHPGWDNNSSMTKLVVHAIQSVEALPSNHPCAPRKSDPNQWPCFQHDPVPHKDGRAIPGASVAGWRRPSEACGFEDWGCGRGVNPGLQAGGIHRSILKKLVARSF